MDLFLAILVLILILPAIALLYAAAAVIGSNIKTRPRGNVQPRSIKIYILTNGMHTDFILPIQNKIFDWSKYLPEQSQKHPTAQWVGVGWGDKGFYLNTPEWKKLKLSVALKALFGFSRTLMHITFHDDMEEHENCTAMYLSEDQYKKLLAYIRKYFQENKSGEVFLLKGCGYTDQDEFYEAHQRYTLFKTCNVWTNRGFWSMGVKTAVWAPFEKTVMKNARKYKNTNETGDQY